MRTRSIITFAAVLVSATLLLGGCKKSAPAPAQANPQAQNQAPQNQPGTLNSDGTQTPPPAAAPASS